MKILHVRLHNLNSLTGTWHIDFTAPAYDENHLFAITGPTGVGKTTLLDAICLALYGATPRLGRISKTSNEIMSRHTGICSAEVEFTTVKGRFRCHWSQHRSRQKADGELQQPKHEIADALNNTILESKLRNVAAKVEKVTGMDFDRFTRSTLLAQGGFAAFLDASPNERGPILEQITGTEIYSRLSIRVHELLTEEGKKLEELQQNFSHITPLPSEEEEILQDLVRKRDREGKRIKTIIDSLRNQQNRLSRIAELRNDLHTCRKQMTALEAEEEKQKPMLQKLHPAHDARKLEPLYLHHQHLLKQQGSTLQEMKTVVQELSSITNTGKECAKQCAQCTVQLQQAEAEEKETKRLIMEVQELDHNIKSIRDNLGRHRDRLAVELKQQNEDNRAVQGLQEKLGRAEQEQEGLCCYFKDHPEDDALTAEFDLIKERISSLREIHNQLDEHGKKRTSARQVTKTQNRAAATLSEKMAAFSSQASEIKDELSKLTRERTELLGGMDTGSLQRELFRLQNRQKGLLDLQLLLEKAAGLREGKKERELKLSNITKQLKNAENSLAELQEKKNGKEREIELLESNLRLAVRVQSLEKERRQLKSDTPCPLCGATEHPYRTSAVPSSSREEDHLRKAKGQGKILDEGIERWIRQQVLFAEQQGSLTRQLRELETTAADRNKECDHLLSALALPPREEMEEKSIFKEAKDLEVLGLKLQQRYDDQRRLKEQIDRVTERTEIQNRTLLDMEKKLLSANHLLSSAKGEEDRLLQEEKELSVKLETHKDQLFKVLAAYKVKDCRTDRLPPLLEELRKRVESWKEKKEQESRLAATLLTLRSDLVHKQESFRKQGLRMEEQENVCRLMKKELSELEEKRETLFGSRDTTDESNRLAHGVKEARQRQHSAEKHRETTNGQLTASRTLEERLKKEHEKRKGEIDEQQETLDRAVRASSFADLDQFLEARLPHEELAEIKELDKELREKKTALQALTRDKLAGLEKEQAGELSSEEPQTLSKRLEDEEKELELLQEQAGAARERLKKKR